jgi:hypothetical protein
MHFRYDIPQLQSPNAKGAKYLFIACLSRYFPALPLPSMGLSTDITSSYMSDLRNNTAKSAVHSHSSLAGPFVPAMGVGVTRLFSTFTRAHI